MSGLFVVQRVRILFSDNWPELKGETGRIVDVCSDGGMTGFSDWMVAPDCWGTPRAPRKGTDGGIRFAPNSRQLEPILPDGHRECEEFFKQELDSLLNRTGALA